VKRYTLELEAHSPIHVGTGEMQPAYTYLPDQKNSCVLLLDLGRLLAKLPPNEQNQLIQAVSQGAKPAQNAILNIQRSNPEYIEAAVSRSIAASKAFLNTVANASNAALLEYRPLPRALEHPYLPGSSLKGALRTAYLYDYLLEKGQPVRFERGSWSYGTDLLGENEAILDLPPRLSPRDAQEFEPFVLEYHEIKKMDRDPFRAVRLSDSSPIPETFLNRISMYHPKGKLNETQVLAETIRTGTKFTHEFQINDDIGSTLGNGKPAIVSKKISAEELSTACRAFYGEVLERELEYAEVEKLENTKINLNKLKDQLKVDPELFPIRVGFGSSEHGLTLSLLTDEELPYTRKTVGATNPQDGHTLGWLIARLKER
jgi:CRISPR-associated protein Csm5